MTRSKLETRSKRENESLSNDHETNKNKRDVRNYNGHMRVGTDGSRELPSLEKEKETNNRNEPNRVTCPPRKGKKITENEMTVTTRSFRT